MSTLGNPSAASCKHATALARSGTHQDLPRRAFHVCLRTACDGCPANQLDIDMTRVSSAKPMVARHLAEYHPVQYIDGAQLWRWSRSNC